MDKNIQLFAKLIKNVDERFESIKNITNIELDEEKIAGSIGDRCILLFQHNVNSYVL